ncbi:MAG: uracil-DNA glycosylase [Gemmatimonadota bacterium]|nr:uracil-DNA glycosylase [Gemmatimonadota bacterium]
MAPLAPKPSPASPPRVEAASAAPEPRPAPASEPAAPPKGSDGAPPSGLVVGTASHELFGGNQPRFNSLEEIAAAVAACTKCGLYKGALNPVPGEGNPNAEFMCVGEAPGAKEDETGRPFVGQAGQLLTKILAAINLTREDVFIGNVLKHRPPGNRNPLPDEIAACSPYLIRQIELIRPKVILALGTFAAQTLLDTKLSIGKLRGQVHRYYGVPLIVTYHPAALLRNPSWKRPTWEDVQLARRILDDARARG